mgnify:CR=1 FL=1
MMRHPIINDIVISKEQVSARTAWGRSFAAVFVLAGLFMEMSTGAYAAPITVPEGLNPSDEYRLAFITSQTRNATSGNIADYNSFVTNVANTHSALSNLGTTWKAIASTSSIHAKDNTGTNFIVDYPNNIGVPIYLLDGITKIADDNVDLWNDGTIDSPLDVNEAGVEVRATDVWTGSNQFGNALFPLGVIAPSPRVGRSDTAGTQWMSLGQSSASLSYPLYALSEVLTVIPEPSSLLLVGCLGSLIACGRIRPRWRT